MPNQLLEETDACGRVGHMAVLFVKWSRLNNLFDGES